MRKDIILPALIGLGLYTQVNNVSICGNNGIMLLLLYVLLEDHAQIEKLCPRECSCQPHHHHNHRNNCC
ncbi:MAG: hypothetical protein FWC00_01610 [Firmicutes bacterium]|nr:hypothetical protein [Bacillota bacterium]